MTRKNSFYGHCCLAVAAVVMALLFTTPVAAPLDVNDQLVNVEVIPTLSPPQEVAAPRPEKVVSWDMHQPGLVGEPACPTTATSRPDLIAGLFGGPAALEWWEKAGIEGPNALDQIIFPAGPRNIHDPFVAFQIELRSADPEARGMIVEV